MTTRQCIEEGCKVRIINPVPDPGEYWRCTPHTIHQQLALAGLEVLVYRSKMDGKLVVEITGPEEKDCTPDDEPNIRIWLNEALIYKSGEVGDNLEGANMEERY